MHPGVLINHGVHLNIIAARLEVTPLETKESKVFQLLQWHFNYGGKEIAPDVHFHTCKNILYNKLTTQVRLCIWPVELLNQEMSMFYDYSICEKNKQTKKKLLICLWAGQDLV